MLTESMYFGLLLSIAAYGAAVVIQKKFPSPLANPLMVSTVMIILVLLGTGVEYAAYEEDARLLSYLLTPVTVSLAIPLYRQIELLKKNVKAILVGIFSGAIAAMLGVFLLSLLFGLNHEQYVTLLPKSITTAIAVGISDTMGGWGTITATAVFITGTTGNVCAAWGCKLFGITDPVAQGVAIGTSSHALGTSKAMEIGEVQGAMSSLAIVVAALITVLAASVFTNFI